MVVLKVVVNVIDASVAVKWLLPEPGSDAAAALLDSGEQLIAPALIRIEVTAAILRKVRMQEIDARGGAVAFRLWLQCLVDGVITLVPDDVHLAAAWAIALRLKHPLQDCLYLALAESRRAVLITADKKFAAHDASGKRIQLLK